MRDKLTFMLSSESLRNETCTARIPAAYGDFFGNFSLYLAASVHGVAEIVKPSCDSSEAVRNGGCCAPPNEPSKPIAANGILRAALGTRL